MTAQPTREPFLRLRTVRRVGGLCPSRQLGPRPPERWASYQARRGGHQLFLGPNRAERRRERLPAPPPLKRRAEQAGTRLRLGSSAPRLLWPQAPFRVPHTSANGGVTSRVTFGVNFTSPAPGTPSWRKTPARGRLTPRRRPSVTVAGLSSGTPTSACQEAKLQTRRDRLADLFLAASRPPNSYRHLGTAPVTGARSC
jgi:hypothetical protein